MIRAIPVFILVSVVSAAEVPPPPPEMQEYTRLTSHEELMNYVETISARAAGVEFEILGESHENRRIPVLHFSDSRSRARADSHRLRVLIYCQQHGNEPGGKEAALLLIDHLIRTPGDVLEKIDLMLVPQVNPDGAERGERRNANDVDLNRNHVILSEIESRLIHDLFIDFMPHVTLDVHEYGAIRESWVRNGMVKDADVMLGGVTNLNVSDRIARYSRDTIIPGVGALIEKEGYSFHRYVVGTPFDGGRMRYSTTDINDGRTSMGLYQTFSFIQEGKRYPDQTDVLERRAESQFHAVLSFLAVVAEHADSLIMITDEARNSLLDGDRVDTVVIQSDYYSDSTETTLRFPVFDLIEWEHIDRELPNFEPVIRARKSIPIPHAYCIPGSEERLIDVIRRHGIEVQTLERSRKMIVEAYRIKHVTPMEEEELTVPNVDVERFETSITPDPGTIVIPTRQWARVVIPLLLEPQSTRGLVTRGGAGSEHFGAYLAEGTVFPVYRIPVQGIDTKSVE